MEFVALKQGQVTTNASTSASYTIPTIPELPPGIPLMVKVCSTTGALWKAGRSADTASKTVTSNNYPDLNIYAEANAIEIYAISSDSSPAAPTHIHAIADTTAGVIRYCFGYYKKF